MNQENIKNPINNYIERNSLTLELGKNLLSLIDTYYQAPLLEQINQLRKELSLEIGLIIPGIKITDNLNLLPSQYILKIRETPVASGEIFLERYLVIGKLEELGEFQGWSAQDPIYKMPAKWIESKDLKKAEDKGCTIYGPLIILIGHLKETLKLNAKDLLGLQELRYILEDIASTHPIVAEDYLKDNYKLRKLRLILHNLLLEKVSMRDLITILEVVGDHFEEIEKIDLISEYVRMTLAKQICWNYLDQELLLKAINLNLNLEKKLLQSIEELPKLTLRISEEEAQNLVFAIKKTHQEFPQARVLITTPPLRLFVRKLTRPLLPNLGIISNLEIPLGIRLEILAEVNLKEEVKEKSKNKKFFKI